MYVLITHDVATGEDGGERRLRRVAKTRVKYGQRVQCSVFECLLDPAQFELLKHELAEIIDEERDSLLFYNLGKNWKRRVERLGANDSYDPEGLLLI
ncbi:CRISPR-associated endonuclease Cas2 [Collinsella ihumii]|uniref:CRISPR-associated endoribonuclease Cas2 n=1 Tax=Collinsella ihumii TaxID=1720204 RepID=A0AAW7JS56_9ACTN|nr:CRISPR-associated endonuclease Cas2 [Collinsella ihumii]MDN0068446.1 CRISPR-associated endonuclease Cas2 [Collinsella ihumii]